MFALDRELEAVVETTTDPRIGEIRLAWWRERLTALDGPAPPPAQPTLVALAAHVVPALADGATLAGLEDGFLLWLDGGHAAAAAARGTALFALAARALGGGDSGGGSDGDPGGAGPAWAAGAMRRRGLAVAPVAAPRRLARPLRPLLALARAGGRPPAEPALAPARQLAFAWTMLAG